MLYHIVACLLGGPNLAESFHVHPTRRWSVARPGLGMAGAGASFSPEAGSGAAVADPDKEETLDWNKQVRCITAKARSVDRDGATEVNNL